MTRFFASRQTVSFISSLAAVLLGLAPACGRTNQVVQEPCSADADCQGTCGNAGTPSCKAGFCVCEEAACMANADCASFCGDAGVPECQSGGCFCNSCPNVTRGQLAGIVMPLGDPSYSTYMPPGPQFPDVPMADPSYKAIMDAADKGVLGALPDGLFHPGNTVQRSEAAEILAFGLNLVLVKNPPDPTQSDFSDVPTSASYAGFVHALVKAGVVDKSSGLFQPDKLADSCWVNGLVNAIKPGLPQFFPTKVVIGWAPSSPTLPIMVQPGQAGIDALNFDVTTTVDGTVNQVIAELTTFDGKDLPLDQVVKEVHLFNGAIEVAQAGLINLHMVPGSSGYGADAVLALSPGHSQKAHQVEQYNIVIDLKPGISQEVHFNLLLGFCPEPFPGVALTDKDGNPIPTSAPFVKMCSTIWSPTIVVQ